MKTIILQFLATLPKSNNVKTKIALLSGIFLLFGNTIIAQYKPVVIGLSFNPGLSWINPENNHYTSEGTSFSYSYGVDIDFYFKANYAFSTGLQIQNLKGNVKYPDLYSPSGNDNVSNTKTLSAHFSFNSRHLLSL